MVSLKGSKEGDLVRANLFWAWAFPVAKMPEGLTGQVSCLQGLPSQWHAGPAESNWKQVHTTRVLHVAALC